MSHSLWCSVLLLSWTVLVSLPLFTFSWLQLNKHYKAQYFQKRKAALIVSQTIIMFISTCIVLPLIVLSYPNHLDVLHISPLLQQIIDVIYGQLLLSIPMIMLIRIWCLNFNHNLQLNMSNSTWKKQLSSYSLRADSTFYTKYRNTLGSLSWLLGTFGSIYLLLCVLLVLIEFAFPLSDTSSYSISIGILSAAYTITTAIIIVIWIKYPTFKDNMFIREELKESIWFVLIVLFIAGLILFIMRMLRIRSVQCLSLFVVVLVMDGLCYITVLRVIMLNNKRGAMHDLARHVDNNPHQFTMHNILENKNGYEEFMKFLVQEWASENLLFATEYSQLRDSLDLSETQKDLLGCNIVFDTVMSSKTSEFRCDTELDDCKQFIDISTKLYEKYIAFDTSNYEINVSYHARMSLAMVVDEAYKEVDPASDKKCAIELPTDDLHQAIQIVIPLFEMILLEVTRLLEQSFSRFKRSQIWTELCDEIIAHKGSKYKYSIRALKAQLPLPRPLSPNSKARQKFEFQTTPSVLGITKTNSLQIKGNVVRHVSSMSGNQEGDLDQIVLNSYALQPSLSAPSTLDSDAPNVFVDEIMTCSVATKDSSFVE
eukprot:288491_1